MPTPPTLLDKPATPEPWECRDITATDTILGPWRYGDPANVTDIGIDQIADNALSELRSWHRIAENHPRMVPPWLHIFAPETFSGHKLHIACSNLGQVREALALVLPTCWRAGLGLKAASSGDVLIRRQKGVVVYLPRRATVDRDTTLICRALGAWRPGPAVVVSGDVRITDAVWWRYEFGTTVPDYDVTPLEYRRLYVAA